jgi:hypothetical protein
VPRPRRAGWVGQPDDVVRLGPIPDSVLEPPTRRRGRRRRWLSCDLLLFLPLDGFDHPVERTVST